MKKHLQSKTAWIQVHTPFLKTILIIIGIWIPVMTGIKIYSVVNVTRAEIVFKKYESEAIAFDMLQDTLDYFALNPGELDRYLSEGISFPEGFNITMRQISKAESPQDTWQIIGWKNDGDEIYRLEKCFAVPGEPDKN